MLFIKSQNEFNICLFTLYFLSYKNIVRNIIYYVADGNTFVPPEIEDAKNNNTLDCIWWSMSCISKQTIEYLRPNYLITFNTRLDAKPEEYILRENVNTIRIWPYANKINIQDAVFHVFST